MLVLHIKILTLRTCACNHECVDDHHHHRLVRTNTAIIIADQRNTQRNAPRGPKITVVAPH